MRLVVADTGPINYLILIGLVDLLPALFENVILPAAVANELNAPDTPLVVRRWMADLPGWLDISYDTPTFDAALERLDPGEKAAIALAAVLKADLLLIDERDGVKVARKKGLRVTGTLGILDIAAGRGLVNFAEAIQRLGSTTFHQPAALLGALLKKHADGS